MAAKLDDAGSTYREAAVAARGVYEVALFEQHEQQMGAALAGPLAVGKTGLLLEHRFEVAESDKVRATDVSSDVNTYQDGLTAAYAALLLTMNGADTRYVDTVAGAGYSHASNLAAAAKTRSISLSTAEANRDLAAEKADAALARDKAVAESAYQRDIVGVETAFHDAMASTNTAWVKAIALAEMLWEINPDDPLRDKRRDYGYAVAGADAHLLSVKATTIRTDAVGAAQDTRATALGTSGKTHADALATAGTTYVSATSSADVAYINAAASADNGLVAAVTGADTTFANKSATANRTLTGSLGAANVKLVQDTGAATVTQSHTIAASEAEFHQEEIYQNVSRWSNLIGYTPTELIPYETEYRQALDQAIYSWRAVTRSAFTDFVTNSTQADTDQTSDVADAGRVQANAKGDADVAFTASSSPLAATLQRNTASTINDYTVGTVTRDNARLTELANALATLTKDEGEAEKTRAIDVAAAEHTWQSAKAQAEEDYTAIQTQAEKTLAAAVLTAEINYYNDSDYAAYLAAIEAAGEVYSDTVEPAAHARWTTLQEAELTYKQAVGEADLALATAKSASREGWIDATVDAEKQFVDDESHAIEQRRDNIAGYQQTYATSLASVVGDRDVDNAEALTDFWDAEQEADNTWLASAAAAQAGFWDADYMQSPHLGLSLPLPWTGAMNSLGGAALQAWQFSARSGYTGLASSINSTNTAYQDTLTSQYRSLANSLRTTDVSLATSLADAEHTHATTFASLESQFFVDMADLSNTYLHDTEEASHVSRVASATATRHLFVGIDYDGNNFGQTEFSAALSAASVVFSEARQEIERIYDRGDVTTFGAFNIALATNTHGYFATSTAANLSHTQGTAALERGYSHQEAAANHARETMVAGLDENYRRLESAALAGEVASFLGSPWLVLNKELVDTDNDFRQAESTAAEALRTAVADADQTLENAAADALETLTNRLAEIGAEEVMAETDGELNNAIATAIESITDFHAGKTNPANPTLPSLPRVYSHAIDAVIDEDYASAGEFYEGSAYWGWDNGFYTNSLRFFGTQPTDRSKLPQSFPKLYQVSRDLDRHIAERREFALSYELMMEGYYTDEVLSSFEAIGRLGDYYHEFVSTNIEVPTGAIEGLGAGVVYAFTDEGKGADHAFGARSAPKAMEFSDEPGTDDNTDTTDLHGGSGPGLPNGNHPTATGGSGGTPTADGPVYGPAPPPDHRLPRPEEKRLPTITITEFVESLENAKRDETVNADTVYDKYIELFGTQGIALFAWAVQNGWEIRFTNGFGTPWINTTDKVIVIQAFMPMQGIASDGFGVIIFKRDKPERHTVEFAARELHKLLKAAYAHAADTETKRLELDAMLGGDDYLGMAWPERYYRFNTAWMLNSWIGCGILHAENACMGETILGHELTTRQRLWLGAVGSVETILSATGIASLGGGAIGNKVAKSVLTPAAYRALSVDIVQHLGEQAVRALISSPSGKEFLRAVARLRVSSGQVRLGAVDANTGGRGLFHWVKAGGTVDDALRSNYIAIAQSPQMAQAVSRYNKLATFFRQKPSATIDEIVEALGSDVTFSKIGHLQSGLFVPGEHAGLTRYWIQGMPTTAYGQRAAVHELTHLGAALRGQGDTILHEIAVQAVTTPENLVIFTVGFIVVIGGEAYWVFSQ